MPPSRIFPPVEFCRGTKPNQAANSRPERNSFASATVVAMAVAMNRSNPRNAGQPLTYGVRFVPSQELPLQCCNRRLDLLELRRQHLQYLLRHSRQADVGIVANNGDQLANIAQAPPPHDSHPRPIPP